MILLRRVTSSDVSVLYEKHPAIDTRCSRAGMLLNTLPLRAQNTIRRRSAQPP